MGARVLVVDDDPWILRMVSATLEKKGYAVDTAREGRHALERVQAARPDVIITDVMMPVMDGWQLVQTLRAIPELAAIPVIFLTALGKDESKLREAGLGPDDYLAKPFRFSDLERRVEKALAVALPVVDPNAPMDPNAPYYPPGYPAYPGTYPAGYPGVPAGAYPYPGAYPPGNLPPYPYPNPGVRQPTPAAIPVPHPSARQPTPPVISVPPTGPRHPTPPVVSVPSTPSVRQPTPPAIPVPGSGMPPLARTGPQPSGHLTPSGQFPAQHRSTAMSGRLEQLGLSSLLVMMEMERKDGVLTLKDLESGVIGRIFLRRGQVVSARVDTAPPTDGRASVYKMLTWKAGAFSFNAMEVDMDDTVQSSTTHLLMEGARLMDEANR